MDFTLSLLSPGVFFTAVLCCLAYVLGVGRRKQTMEHARVVKKTKRAVAEIHTVLKELQHGLKKHQSNFHGFKDRLKGNSSIALNDLEAIIRSSRTLTSEISFGQSRIAKHVDELSAVAESRTDPLTSLGNRRLFEEEIAKLTTGVRNDTQPFVVAILDVDHFKRINDMHGHQTGDMVLQHIARVLQDEVRQDDVVARVGAEEFAIIFVGCGPEAAASVLARMQAKIESTVVVIGNQAISVTVSAGLATTNAEGETGLSLMTRADAALYHAKQSGRNRVCVA